MNFPYKNSRIFYEVNGSGEPIVLLHGFLESSAIWERLIPQLAKNYTTITIDLPGHGKSEQLSEIHSMELMAEVVKSLLDILRITKTSFIGHSMGGYVVLAFADMFPSEVDKLILLNSTPAADSIERRLNRDRALELISRNPKAFINVAIESLFAKASRSVYSEEIKQLQHHALQFPISGIAAAIRGMRDRKDRTEVLRKIKGQKFMICAKEDPILPITDLKLIARLTNSNLKIVDGGHMTLIENYSEIEEFVHFIE